MTKREFDGILMGRDRLVWFEDIKPQKELGLTEVRFYKKLNNILYNKNKY